MSWQSYQVCIALLLTKITTFDQQNRYGKRFLIFFFLEQMDGLDKAAGYGEDRRQASARGAKSDGSGNDRFVGAGEDRRQASARGAKSAGIGNDRGYGGYGGYGRDRFVGAGEDRRQALAGGSKSGAGIGNARDGCRDNKC